MRRFNQVQLKRQRRTKNQPHNDLKELVSTSESRRPAVEEYVRAKRDMLKSYDYYAEEYWSALGNYDRLSDDEKLIFPPNEEAYVIERFKSDLECERFSSPVDIDIFLNALHLYPEEENKRFFKANRNMTYEHWAHPGIAFRRSQMDLQAGDHVVIVERSMQGICFTDATITLLSSDGDCRILRDGESSGSFHNPYGLFVSRDEAIDYMRQQARKQIANARRKLKKRKAEKL